MSIKELQSEWELFIESQKLYILVETKGNGAFDFLRHLSFSNPEHTVRESLESFTIDVSYTGSLESLKEIFKIGVYEHNQYGELYGSDWEINSNRETVYPSHGIGMYFEEYFHFFKSSNRLVSELLDLFELKKWITDLSECKTV